MYYVYLTISRFGCLFILCFCALNLYFIKTQNLSFNNLYFFCRSESSDHPVPKRPKLGINRNSGNTESQQVAESDEVSSISSESSIASTTIPLESSQSHSNRDSNEHSHGYPAETHETPGGVYDSFSNLDPYDCYVVSADCKLCGERFDDFTDYRLHLKQHFDDDPNKQWTICHEPGCDGISIESIPEFVAHLADIHRFANPFWCMLAKDGTDCTYSASSESNIYHHLATEHGISITSEGSVEDTEDESEDADYVVDGERTDDLEQETRGRGRRSTNNQERAPSRSPSTMALNQYLGIYYEESADCILCGTHCNSFTKYKQHLKEHFNQDPTKKWLRCNEKGCDPEKRWTTYIPHLCKHGHNYPFHCIVKGKDGNKCTYQGTSKQLIVNHLKSVHRIEL